jgi:hypothetical protein
MSLATFWAIFSQTYLVTLVYATCFIYFKAEKVLTSNRPTSTHRTTYLHIYICTWY